MRAAALLLAGLATLGACDGCKSKAHVAAVEQLSGLVEVDDAAPALAWALAAPGQELALGEAIRTGARAQATLELVGGGKLVVRERSVVRFSSQPQARGGYRVGVELGEAEVESGAAPISFDTMFGAATIERGTRVRLVGGQGGRDGQTGALRFQVVVGSATVETGGQSTRIAQGQTFVVDVGGAIIEETARPDASAPPLPPPPPVAQAPVVEQEEPNAQGLATVVQGDGARVRAADGAWRALTAGETRLPEGTRVSVAQGSSVEVRGEHGTALIRGSAEFVVGGEAGALVTASNGTVVVTSSDEMRVQVPGGAIVVRQGAAELDVARDGTRVDVRSGTASIDGRQGELALSAGEGTTLRRDGTTPTEERAPAHAKFTITAGENATVHDPAAPTAVRVRFSCPADGVVEVARGGSFARPIVSRGRGSANVLMPLGAQRYRVRCVDGGAIDENPVASGSLRIVRDAGTQSLPRTAPRTSVETDGRRYTVLYQAKLPEIAVTWPRAPQSSGGYQLTVTGPGGRAQNVRSQTPTTTFASGRLDEGTYTLTWATADGASRSRPTTLQLEFDDDTPVAYLRSPSPTEALSGTVHVEGIAQEGATASAGGVALAVERARFRGDVPVPADECLAVRVAHPERGVHYYLRCGGR